MLPLKPNASLKIDEAHERSIYTDLILGILKKCAPIQESKAIIDALGRFLSQDSPKTTIAPNHYILGHTGCHLLPRLLQLGELTG